MDQAQWNKLEAELGHVFARRELLQRAVTHSSLAFEQSTESREGLRKPAGSNEALAECLADNEQLEFLGDAVLGLIVAESLCARYPEFEEGDLTRLRATLVSRKHLGTVALAHDLGEFLRLGRGEERSGGRRKAVLLANLLEALLAALYLDGGLEVARRFALRTIVDPFAEALRRDLERGDSMGDHKSALQELLQARRSAPPEYQVKEESGPDHRKRFLVEVKVCGDAETPGTTAQGSGSTKKKAEQEAARLAYARLHFEEQAVEERSDRGQTGGEAATRQITGSDATDPRAKDGAKDGAKDAAP